MSIIVNELMAKTIADIEAELRSIEVDIKSLTTQLGRKTERRIQILAAVKELKEIQSRCKGNA